MSPGNTEPMSVDKTVLKARIDAVAATISQQPLSLAYHRPESWAQAARCFENVSRKVLQHGGGIRYGWTFHHRIVESIAGPGYLFVTHHAVWHAPDGHLVDVSSYPDTRHRPIAPGGSPLFLVDDKALPIQTEKLLAPLPLRFFVIDDDDRMVAYVKRLNEEEQEKCRKIYDSVPHGSTALPSGWWQGAGSPLDQRPIRVTEDGHCPSSEIEFSSIRPPT
jgi:hypothetical protein